MFTTNAIDIYNTSRNQLKMAQVLMSYVPGATKDFFNQRFTLESHWVKI